MSGSREGNLKRIVFFLLAAFFVAGTAILPAQEKKGQTKQPSPAAPAAPTVPAVDENSFVLKDADATAVGGAERTVAAFGLWDFIKMVIVLVAVVGLIYSFFHFLRKMSSPKDEGLRYVQVLETRNLSGNRNIHLVEVGNLMLLVGSAENGVNLIAEITDQETRDGIKLKASETRAEPAKRFADVLKGFLPKGGKHPPTSAGGDEAFDFMNKQKERLKKLL